MVFRTCYAVTHNSHDAEDAAQAAFFALAEQLRAGTEIRSPGSWLQQVAQRASLDLCRGRKRRRRREDVVRQNRNHSVGPVCSIDAAEIAELVKAELQTLPADYRTPLILHYYGGLSTGQIARQLNCGVKALGMRLLRGRRLLAQRLAARGVVLGAAGLTAALVGLVRQNVGLHAIAQAGCASPLHAAMNDGLMSQLFLRLIRAVSANPRRSAFVAAIFAGAALSGGSQSIWTVARQVIDPHRWFEGWNLNFESLFDRDRLLPRLRLGDATPHRPADGVGPAHVAAPRPLAMPQPASGPTLPANWLQSPVARQTFLQSTPTAHPSSPAYSVFLTPSLSERISTTTAGHPTHARRQVDTSALALFHRSEDTNPGRGIDSDALDAVGEDAVAILGPGLPSALPKPPAVVDSSAVAIVDSVRSEGKLNLDSFAANGRTATLNGASAGFGDRFNVVPATSGLGYVATDSVGGIPEPTVGAPIIVTAMLLIRRRRRNA